MPAIEALIHKTHSDLLEERSKARATSQSVSGRWAMPWLLATRLHALLDCYVAIGGSDAKWRNEAKVLR